MGEVSVARRHSRSTACDVRQKGSESPRIAFTCRRNDDGVKIVHKTLSEKQKKSTTSFSLFGFPVTKVSVVLARFAAEAAILFYQKRDFPYRRNINGRYQCGRECGIVGCSLFSGVRFSVPSSGAAVLPIAREVSTA